MGGRIVNFNERFISGSILALAALIGAVAAAGCAAGQSVSGPATNGSNSTATAVRVKSDTVISGADTAYYFDEADKLVAVEDVYGVGRKIVRSEENSNDDGMSMIMKSSCQDAMPKFGDGTEMAGKAATVVYTVGSLSTMTVLGVEDLTGVASRMITPLRTAETGGICCCALKRCGPTYCCPCPNKTC